MVPRRVLRIPGRLHRFARVAAGVLVLLAATDLTLRGSEATGPAADPVLQSPEPVSYSPAESSTLPATRSPHGTESRPFDHDRHQSIACTDCHGAGERHRTNLVRTARDCAACHHAPDRQADCARCHEPETLPAAHAVPVSLSLSVWLAPRPRILPFRHGNHIAVECRECHRAPVSRAVSRDCAACHEQHHRPAAQCATCHAVPERGAHPPETHLSCAGAGCHAPAVAPPPTLSRALCLTCHGEQRVHEPQGNCAACHQIPAPASGVAAWDPGGGGAP